jgi:hypothetical protein
MEGGREGEGMSAHKVSLRPVPALCMYMAWHGTARLEPSAKAWCLNRMCTPLGAAPSILAWPGLGAAHPTRHAADASQQLTHLNPQ